MGRKLEEENLESSSGSDSSDGIEPDGGWGWIVCAGAFLVNFILDGTMFSFGVLMLDLLDYFGQGKAKTAWVGSALLGMSMFMGPVVSIFLEKFSCRQITIFGALLSSCAFIVSIFSPNVEVLIITYGVVGGIGFCMTYMSSLIVVGMYFNRKRAIATGIATSGSGLGTFAYAYMTNVLLDKYDWKGTVLIISAVLLHVVACGAIYRPLRTGGRSSEESSIETLPDEIDIKVTDELGKLLPVHIDHPRDKRFLKVDRVNYLKYDEMHVPERLVASTEDVSSAYHEHMIGSKCPRYFSSQHDFRTVDPMIENTRHRHPSHHSSRHLLRPMSRKDIFYSGSLARLPQGCDQTGTMESDDSAISEHSEDSSENLTSRIRKILISHFSLFKEKTFILLLLANVFWTVQSVPLTYIPDLGVSKQLPTSQAAMLISIVGIANIFGRVISGIITDVFHIQSIVTYTCTLLTASLVNFLLPWCESFATLALCSAVFGLCMATAVSMRTIVLADHLGIDQLTRAFGMVALFQGVAFMTNAPLAGFLYEEFDSYIVPFCFSGMMYLLSGILCLIVYCLSRGKARLIAEGPENYNNTNTHKEQLSDEARLSTR